jgi:hypothetical protein
MRARDVYIPDPYQPNIQKQPYVIVMTEGDYETLGIKYGKYKKWKDVIPGRGNYLESEEGDVDEESETDLEDDSVQIILYFNKSKDLMYVVANGVNLTHEENPIPFIHKNYPIVPFLFERFANVEFAWGNSVPNVNREDQELVNSLWRMMTDGTKLKSKPPLLMSNPELASIDLVVPGTAAVIAPDDRIETIAAVTQGPSNAEFQMLQLAERQIDENSVDPLVSGQTPAGDPTATEVRAIISSADNMRGMSMDFIGSSLVAHAHLRVQNLLWFIAHDDKAKKIIRDGVKVRGSEGRREIAFVLPEEIPSSFMLLKEETELERKGESTEKIFEDVENINNYRYFVSVSATPKPKKKSSNQMLKAIQKYRLYASSPLFDQVENARDLARALGDDPDEMVKDMETQQAPETVGLPAQMPAPQPTEQPLV